MNPSDVLKSYLRTGVPLLAGMVAVWLVGTAAARFGIQIEGEAAYVVVYAVTTMGLYAAARWLEGRTWPPARWLGRLILSAGLNVGPPTYKPPAAPGTVRMRTGPPPIR